MRKPRNRRRGRKNRPHPKELYVEMATRIQKTFREFCAGRYIGMCANYNDTDFISMNPICEVPRDLLFVTRNTGFDARELFTWMLKTNADPISREEFTVAQRQKCAGLLRQFVNNSRKTQLGKKGFFCRHRAVLNALHRYAKYPENGRGSKQE